MKNRTSSDGLLTHDDWLNDSYDTVLMLWLSQKPDLNIMN